MGHVECFIVSRCIAVQSVHGDVQLCN